MKSILAYHMFKEKTDLPRINALILPLL